MKSITSSCTICRHGILKSIVSDNGPQFISSEFKTFCENNGISHITMAVYKPSTNGQCERVVQIVKSALRQACLTNEDPDTTLPRFLLRPVLLHIREQESPIPCYYMVVNFVLD